MTDTSIKLLSLAIMWSASLIALALSPSYKEYMAGFSFLVLSVWFVVYFLLSRSRHPKWK
jgi:hypothetical protein